MTNYTVLLNGTIYPSSAEQIEIIDKLLDDGIEEAAIEAAIEAGIDLDCFDELFQGEYDTMTHFAQDYLEEVWDIPGHLDGYIDWEKVGLDLELGGDFSFLNGHVFSNH